jgi:hypothetical protein
MTFSATVKTGTSMARCAPCRCRPRWRPAAPDVAFAVDQNRPRCPLQQPVQTFIREHRMPFLPSSAWISPGSTVRSMGRRDQAPKPADAVQFESQRNLPGRAVWGGGSDKPAPVAMISPREPACCHELRRESLPSAHQPLRSYLGELGEVTFTVPEMMSFFSCSTSALRPASILLSNSWYGAIETPLFFSVPMKPAVEARPRPCAL